jgi:integrase/recombinase XerD
MASRPRARDLPTLPASRPVSFLMLNPPPRPANHPMYVYLDRLAPTSRRAMEAALARVARLLLLPPDGIRWWAIPDPYLSAIRDALGREHAAATAKQSLSAVRGVAKVALEVGAGISPERYRAYLDILRLPAAPAARRKVPSKRQTDRMIETARAAGDPKGIRDAALLAVLVGAGLKRSEVAALRLADYEPRSGRLTVAKETIRLAPEERALLKNWIGYRGRAQGPLFRPMRKGGVIERRRMSGQAIALIVAERAEQGRLGPVSPEDLRRAALGSRA